MQTCVPGFLGLEAKDSDYKHSRFVVLPIPYDATTSYNVGTRHGPEAILRASGQVELFDEELGGEFHRAGVATLLPVEAEARGPEAMHEAIFRAARPVVAAGKFLFGLGGEHGVTSGLVRAVMTKHKKLSVLQIDAHSDLRDAYHGSPYSHASVMRRVVDYGATLVPVGIRAVSAEDHRFMKRAGIRPVTARDCMMTEDWVDRILDSLGDTVYVTIDIDGFDPAYAPGTGTPEPGGLDWYQVTGLLRLVAAEKNIVAADLVEVMPLPGQTVTEFLAARLAYKLMAYVQARK
ncbi:MAG: agmatinase [Phycisphaerae bacterium]|nr:agmatinase [Planctomycetia bacterium]MCK6466211.1 agmatinase [Phycisphaerae bacterium]MCL4719958.1 agmatinase [Phycisphaerae bacterium]NUQ10258.1 agmatinase [Phycisphaerae bacterium]